jgi:hypothetical protein
MVGSTVSGDAAGAVPGADSWLTIQADVPGPGTNTLTYAGIPESAYVSFYSTNLMTGPWVPFFTNAPGINGTGTVVDASATNTQRFYRLNGPL